REQTDLRTGSERLRGVIRRLDPEASSYFGPPQVNSHNIGACDATCQRKCQASWQVGGFPSVGACYAKWSRLNAMGVARECEAKARAQGYRPPAIPGC